MKGNSIGLILIIAAMAVATAAVFFCSLQAAGHSHGVSYSSPGQVDDLSTNKGFRFEESSTVKGSGEVSIKGAFHDSSVDSSGWMKGSGSISLDSLRSMNKAGREVEFQQKSDLVFTGGLLKNKKSMSLPFFEKGRGATVSERFNLSHVDKSETDMVRSINNYNNTMIFDAALAFEGLWNIKNTKGWSMNMDKRNEIYTGSFQTQKRIEFNDSEILT